MRDGPIRRDAPAELAMSYEAQIQDES